MRLGIMAEFSENKEKLKFDITEEWIELFDRKCNKCMIMTTFFNQFSPMQLLFALKWTL